MEKFLSGVRGHMRGCSHGYLIENLSERKLLVLHKG